MTLTPFLAGSLVAVGLILGYLVRRFLALRQLNSTEAKIREQLKAAKTQAEELILVAKDKAASLLEEVQREERSRKVQLERLEERLLNKEDFLDKRSLDIDGREKNIGKGLEELKEAKAKIDDLELKTVEKLEKISGLTHQQAKEQLLGNLENFHRDELAGLLQKFEKEKRDVMEKKALEVITTALQRYSRSHVADLTTSAVTLPNEELKGKIIGREGRNIRALERLTGVEVIVDETPESITISSFDPLRREIAKMALEKLIRDGRIQPVKIEEKVEEAKQELDQRIKEIGEAAAYEVSVLDLPKEITFLLGKLNYRTSYGQNVLVHSIEMAHLAGMMALELGVNVEVAKKGALLHDIGKAIDHEIEGNHVELGRKILKKYNINEEVIRAMESHHEDFPFATPESFIVAAADILSTARPGARRDTLENYLRRLEDLEKLVLGFEGVKVAYAVSGGREIRIFVIPEKIDDFGALRLARDIAAKIQSELKYPGEIKVNVIREIRAVEYAR
ncbi:ribonuclease Y [Candidatus Jorgensenbacteria bacterium RIFCSPLOWO2_12_FULL_42_11]|uniref:Ribonuclease Y n=1 Tax=Candidatus Jorgensenbacteria bacterium RIFCSPLOWO2_12_FULL_42_11 TaxID=1798473 RepID=A0A1F6C226_9BACT|nr:MAG: ribonuclease Y [Candidatus Jorgensenbacteria bacterium RIFCSPLOWO2_12_FULL_42_11]